MKNEGTIIYDFIWKTEKILEDKLYGVVRYENPKRADIDICVVCHERDENHAEKLVKLKKDLEKKYKIKIAVLYLPSNIFFEDLSRKAAKLGKDTIQYQTIIFYNNSDFYQFVLRSIMSPVKKPSLKIEEYRL